MGLGFSMGYRNGVNMKDLEYKNKTIRMDERTWQLFKDKRKKSGLSWNRYIYKLIVEKKTYGDK